jgi:hypothetical protein
MDGTYIRKAIQRAIGAGWSGPVWLNPRTKTQREGSWGEFNEFGSATTEWDYEYYLLDREFWQYLAKAEAWKGSGVKSAESARPTLPSPGLHNWRRFLHHVAQGKDAESFVRTILTQVEKPEHESAESTGSTDTTCAN